MADRYVNYDKLLEERHRLGLDEMSKIHKVNAFNHFIDNIPTADVVEVVRCKDCKHRLKSPITDRVFCTVHGIKRNNTWYGTTAINDNHFCGDGERKPQKEV